MIDKKDLDEGINNIRYETKSLINNSEKNNESNIDDEKIKITKKKGNMKFHNELKMVIMKI